MEALAKKWAGIAARISKILKERGWSQAELARRAGVPKSYITRLMRAEGDSPPTLRTIVAIETALQASVIEVSRSRIRELSE